MAKVGIIGSGFSGLSSACFAAQKGHSVTVFEKNSMVGGRARHFSENGFMFDMGPSWYWMPDIFENFFNQFGHSVSDFYQLVKTNPAFQVVFKNSSPLMVPNSLEELYVTFESIEKGSSAKLKKFMAEGELKYRVAMNQLIYKPALSWMEFANYDVIKGALQSHSFKSMSSYVRSFFKDERLIALMEFPVLFLGAMPGQIPALYSLMNYAAFTLGTWYPMGGMCKITQAMQQLAEKMGVEFKTNTSVDKIIVSDYLATELRTSHSFFETDAIIATGDYHHIENALLDREYRNYEKEYWDKKVMAPSCLIFYIGVSERVNNLVHHNLFFDADFSQHARDIYKEPRWPEEPLFYVCCPSKTDHSVAPVGMENLFVLIPLAAGIEDTETLREAYYQKVMERLEKHCQQQIRGKVNYKRSYCVSDFMQDYNAFKGNAYGLANTLRQTAVLKPSIQNKKVKNLFYAGQLTVPGPGVPPALISGQIAAGQISKYLKKANHSLTAHT